MKFVKSRIERYFLVAENFELRMSYSCYKFFQEDLYIFDTISLTKNKTPQPKLFQCLSTGFFVSSYINRIFSHCLLSFDK